MLNRINKLLIKVPKRFNRNYNKKNNLFIKKQKYNFSLNVEKEEKKNDYEYYYNKLNEKRYYIGGLLGLFLLGYIKKEKNTISFEKLKELIKKGEVKEILLREKYNLDEFTNSEGYCKINGKSCKITNTNWKELYDYLTNEKWKKPYLKITTKKGINYENYLKTFYMLGSLFILFQLIKKSSPKQGSAGSGITMDINPMKIQRITKELSKTKFKHVAGIKEVKQEIEEFVDFLKEPEKYRKMGARIPKGALLSGPPGTGKTLLAKACAGEAGVPFFFVSGSEFVEMFVGVGASRVRQLFKEARKEDKAIIFIDELDAMGKKRGGNLSSNSEADSTLNQLLVEMDGFASSENVIVFAATNRRELLDPALTRPGRFDRLIEVNLPTLEGREEIFVVHLGKLEIGGEKNVGRYAKRLASLTPGFSGADIANICNEAAIEAVRRNHDVVTKFDFEMAVERVIGGVEKKKKGNSEERKIVAVHESGHGVVSWFLEGASPLLKLTIIPRSKGALGFAQYLPNEDSLETKQELTDRIISILAGRIAEEEFFGEVTTGAHDDLQKAYKIAHSIVTKFGMTDNMGFVSYEEDQFGRKNYSESASKNIDRECKNIIDKAGIECRKVIREKKDLIQEMSDLLLEKNTIDLNDIIGVLGQRPFEPKKSFRSFLEQTERDNLEDEEIIKDNSFKEDVGNKGDEDLNKNEKFENDESVKK